MTAAPGEVTAIVGPNGSGKTTLLRALCGDVPHEGCVLLNGHDRRSYAPAALAAVRAVLPQASALAFPFTVIEIVRLGLRAGLSAADDDLPLQALAEVGLAGHANRFYQELSGGEQQRVQLARVLTQVWWPVAKNGPRWLLLDEPVSNLDIGHQMQVMRLMRRYADAGGGAIAVMHDLNLTVMIADKVVLVNRGRILGAGPVSQVFTDANLGAAYGYPCHANRIPEGGRFFLLPHGKEPA